MAIHVDVEIKSPGDILQIDDGLAYPVPHGKPGFEAQYPPGPQESIGFPRPGVIPGESMPRNITHRYWNGFARTGWFE
jgi:hypothetical protein